MTCIQMYLKPRPLSAVYGHSDYLLFGRLFDCEYGLFFGGYGPIPSDATQVYTLRSPASAASLSTFFNEVILNLEADVPDPHRFVRSAWSAPHQLAVAQVDSWTISGSSAKITWFSSPKVTNTSAPGSKYDTLSCSETMSSWTATSTSILIWNYGCICIVLQGSGLASREVFARRWICR